MLRKKKIVSRKNRETEHEYYQPEIMQPNTDDSAFAGTRDIFHEFNLGTPGLKTQPHVYRAFRTTFSPMLKACAGYFKESMFPSKIFLRRLQETPEVFVLLSFIKVGHIIELHLFSELEVALAVVSLTTSVIRDAPDKPNLFTIKQDRKAD